MNNQRTVMQEDSPGRDSQTVKATPAKEPHLKDELTRIDDVLGQSIQEGDVLVISGANCQPFPVATRTVGEVRTILQQVMNVGPDAAVLVNGIPVSADHILRQSDVLEFVKEGGEKGGRVSQH